MKTLSELGFSSRETAKLVLGSETKKSTVNNILKQLDKQRIAKFDKEYDELDDETKEMVARTVQNSRNFWKAFESKAGKTPKPEKKGLKILFISDCQVKPGVDLTYLEAIGQYIVDKSGCIVTGKQKEIKRKIGRAHV